SSIDSFSNSLPHLHRCALLPYTTLFRSDRRAPTVRGEPRVDRGHTDGEGGTADPEEETADEQGRQAAVDEPHEQGGGDRQRHRRSEEHTSELQSRFELVCRLLLDYKQRK